MAQHYSNPKRARDPYALPDVETFHVTSAAECPLCQEGTTIGQHVMDDHNGWYWWPCFPGCLPDGAPNGPFRTEADALADARDGGEEEEGDLCATCGALAVQWREVAGVNGAVPYCAAHGEGD